ncbi:hypothetical protein [Alkalihalobacillus sp. BA299]|uniref:hypothetical protein n=1 Tax=Alkalihalobacillus sp. BA299 TaxID=2815938 RepID=UPI001ADB0D5F|nr:hypothetical protein [Alkalihalobacillus sp. BA299]
MYHYHQNEMNYHDYYRQQPSLQYIPPTVIDRYVNQWITTSIPNYGQVIAYVLDYNPRTGMVSMFIYQPPRYRQQYIQVHYSDMVGISPYFGPTPPRPHHQPSPWQPWQPSPPSPWQPSPPSPWQPSPWQPGQGGGGGFWPWLFGTAFGSGQQQ